MSDLDEAERAVNEALQDAYEANGTEMRLMCNRCAETHQEVVEQCQNDECESEELVWQKFLAT